MFQMILELRNYSKTYFIQIMIDKIKYRENGKKKEKRKRQLDYFGQFCLFNRLNIETCHKK